MNFPFFVAKRIYRNGDGRQKVSRPAIRIATLGVAIGLAVMIVSVSVVLGFKHTIRDKVIGFGSHIVVGNFFSLQNYYDAPIQVNDSVVNALKKINGVNHVQRVAVTQGILKTETDFMGVSFKGVAEEYDTTFIASNMVEGKVPLFSSDKNSNKILISKIIADKLDLKVGSSVYSYFLLGENVRMRKYTVSGIYQTNLTKFDESTCFSDLYGVVKINGWEPDQVSAMEVLVKDFDKLDATYDGVIDNINKHVDKYGATYSSATVQEQNPSIFSWLELLDVNVWIILALMVCVSGFTMISGLLIILLERVQMIGVLKALGARSSTIRRTFLWFAVFIIGKGLLLGNIIGVGVCALQMYTGIVTLDPTTYYVSTAPVELDWMILALLNIATLLISVLVLVVPSFFVSFIHPARSMRYE